MHCLYSPNSLYQVSDAEDLNVSGIFSKQGDKYNCDGLFSNIVSL